MTLLLEMCLLISTTSVRWLTLDWHIRPSNTGMVMLKRYISYKQAHLRWTITGVRLLNLPLPYGNNVMVVVVYLATYLEELHTQTQCLLQGNASVKTNLDTKLKKMRKWVLLLIFNCFILKGCIPVKWTAPEILFGNIEELSPLSDVYV